MDGGRGGWEGDVRGGVRGMDEGWGVDGVRASGLGLGCEVVEVGRERR